jgi:uncharacterized protein involved in exopolysaccharide biosynthesis
MENCRTKILGFILLLGGLVLCGMGFWLLLSPAQYRATVRIKIDPDVTDTSEGGQASYDPYFIQTEFEIIQSQLVLSNVIETLNLNVEWGKKYGDGSPLKVAKTITLLKRRMRLSPVRNNKLIEISFQSEDPNEAAKIANAIPKAYHDYLVNLLKQNSEQGIKAMQQQYQKDEEQIRVLQTNVDLLREKFKIQNDTSPPTNQSETFNSTSLSSYGSTNAAARALAEQEQPYWEKKRDLENMLTFHKLLAVKIALVESDIATQKFFPLVQIVDIAEPPKFPASPNRWLGAALLAIGLFPTLGGFLFLKSSRRQSA